MLPAQMHALAVRHRLQYPVNARTDDGIRMRNGRPVTPERRIIPIEIPKQLLTIADIEAEIARLKALLASMKPAPAPQPEAPMPTFPAISTIQRAVTKHYGITLLDLVSDRRTAVTVLPRQVSIYLSREMTPRSFPFIGKHHGGRDHTTALSAWRKIGRLMETDAEMRATIEKLRAELA